MVSKPGFNLGTNLKINLDGDDTKVAKTDKLDVKHKVKDKPDIKPNKGDKQDVKPVIKPNKEHKQDVKPIDLTSSKILKYREANLILIRSPMRKKRLL